MRSSLVPLALIAALLLGVQACNCGGDPEPVEDASLSARLDAAVRPDAEETEEPDADVVIEEHFKDASTRPDARTPRDASSIPPDAAADLADSSIVEILDAALEATDAMAEPPDAADLPDATLIDFDAGPAVCELGSAGSYATNQSLDLFGQVVYYDGGAALEPGRYRVTYLDGCMKYGGGQDWTIHAYANGSIAWWLVGATTSERVVMPPGTVGYNVATGAYASFDDCVAANLAVPPLEFDFSGGPLGVWLRDSPYSDNMPGVDSRNPTWQLTKLSECPDAGAFP